MLVVDTNVLVYAANVSAPEHIACRRVLEDLRARPTAWYLTWGICFEFLRVVTHHRVFDRPWTAPEAWAFIDALRQSPGLRMLTPDGSFHAVVDELVQSIPSLSGNLFHDAETVALMRTHGISRILTRDTDFHRFPGVQVLDPLRPDHV